MAKQLDPKIAEKLKQYGFDRSACWDCHGTWVILHNVLEKIAAQEGIIFSASQMLYAKNQPMSLYGMRANLVI
jgi:hypothetical protein